MITVDSCRLKAVEARSDFRVGQRLFQAIVAVEPGVRPQENGPVLVVAPQLQRGQRGVGHRSGFDRLLVVKRLLLAVRIPVAIPDWPKNVVGGCYKIEESKR